MPEINRSENRLPLVEFNGAKVRRDGRVILDVESLSIYRGEHVAILGPNGAGKSTLVRTITREVLPLWADPAPVKWLGQDRLETEKLRALCGVVSSVQQFIIDAHLSVEEVVLGGLFGSLVVPKWVTVTDEHRAAVASALAQVGITGFEQRDMTTLSTGEARRVAVARAIVHEPEVLILDEPTAGLDPTAAYALRDTMRRVATSDRTLVLVTHHVEDIVAPINRVVLVKDARVIADGEKSELITENVLSGLYDIPVELEWRNGESRMW